jgi:hypothetical protein
MNVRLPDELNSFNVPLDVPHASHQP